MATISLIKEAIAALKDRTGSSVPAISKWIENEKKLEIKKHVLRAALKKGIDDGTLVMIKASYKLSAEAKKSVVKVAKKSASTSKPKAEVPKSKPVSTKKVPEAKKVSSAPKKVTAVKKNDSSKKVSLSEKKVKSSTTKKPQAPKKASVAKKSKMKESVPKE